MWEIAKEYRFEASHLLPFHDGKCRQMHGHSWVVRVTFAGDLLRHSGPKEGMLLDYGEISDVVKPIIDALDHRHLNDFLPNPTSENLAAHLWEQIVCAFGVMSDAAAMLHSVEINETCTSRCRFTKRLTAYGAMVIERRRAAK